jgi:hypothetical protein
VSFEAPSGGGGAEWGDITGTLSDQTDLQNALNAKFDDPTGTTSQYLRGDGSLATFPSLTGFVPYTGATTNVDLGTHRITAQHATISSSGSGDTFTLNHSSGSGNGLTITKGGNGEGLYINKTSGSGNAATIIGTINATSLVKSGGTSSQFLKADGTVDSSVYVPTSTTLTINGVTFDLSANRTFTVGSVTGSGASGQVAYWTGTSAQSGSNNLFWDASTNRLGIGTTTPITTTHIVGRVSVGDSITTLNSVRAFNLCSTDAGIRILRVSADSLVAAPNFELIHRTTADGANTAAFDVYANSTGLTFRNRTSTDADVLKVTLSNNVILQNGGTFTDSGQRLQVQGTTLLNGNVTFSSSTGMFWDATNSRLGIGTNVPAYKLHNVGSSGFDNGASGDAITLLNGGFIRFGTGARFRALSTSFQFQDNNYNDKITFSTSGNISTFNTGGNYHFGGTTDSGERLQVTGTMKVTGNITGGFSTNALYNASNGNLSTNRVSNISNNSWLELFGAASISTTNSSIYLGSREGLSWNSTSGVRNVIETYNNINPTSGTAVTNIFSITGIINQTGGANGITRGLYVNPTLTAAADFRAIETARGNVVFGNLPTSPVGLPSGAIWNNLGILTIV